MKYQIYFRRFCATVVLSLSLVTAFAGDDDSTLLQKAIKAATRRAITDLHATSTNRSFSELDKYLSTQSFSLQDNSSEFTEEFFQKLNTSTPSIEEEKAKARASIGEVEAANSYVDFLTPSDINQLPIGLKKKVGNTDVTIAVSSAIFTSKYAELTLYARVKIPQSAGNAKSELFFGIKGLKLSYDRGIIGDAKLVLLGDFSIPINGDKATLVLKGGFDINTGQGVDKTYITIDCNGFKELGLTAEVVFPRTMMVPVNQAGSVIEGDARVTAGINDLHISNWNDITASVTFNKSFQLNGLKGIVFNVTTAAFDLSDYHNEPNIVYPPGYQQKYLPADNINTWKGFYVKNLSVSLPKAFKNREKPEELVTFGVNDLIIDNNGITGLFYAQNVLPITKGNASGWKFSVDSIRIALEANRLVRAGFGGRLGLPVNTSYDTANKRKFLSYSAFITSASDYVCRVTNISEMDFDLWKAKAVLEPNSYIQLSGNADEFKPEAMLFGRIGIVAESSSADTTQKRNSKNPLANMQGIVFKGLHLTTTAPYITASYFGYEGAIKLGNFPVSITNIGLKSMPNDELALDFGLQVNLHENEFSGSTRLNIIGKMQPEQGILSWKFSRIRVEEIAISATIKESFKISGRARFMDDDPVYGDGFAGSLKVEVLKPKKITVDVTAVFGKKSFRYWYFDGTVDLGNGVPGGFKITGFGGGAYYQMKPGSITASGTGTGMSYVPDSTAGLGFKASVLFSFGSTSLSNGTASLEMSFNKGGGLRYIGLFGFAKIMKKIEIPGGVTSFVSDNFKKVNDKIKGLDSTARAELDKIKQANPTKAAEKQTESSEKPGDSGISGYVGISYDFNAQTLHANFDIFINTAGGTLRGIGNNNRAGWAIIHVDPKEWYIHMGTPTDPIGIQFGIGPVSVKTTAYFMLGYRMPKFPDPPQKVIDVLRESGLVYDSKLSADDLDGGRGLAFGASVSMNTGDLKFLIFYANFAAGLGFDVMLKDYGNAHCEGSSGQIGVNGWYAQGQAYAYLQGELGIRIKIGPFKKNISLIKGGAAALLQARLPNPTWVGGAMGFYLQILGGLIKGHFNFQFSFGDECKIVKADGEVDDNLKIIETLAPDPDAQKVSLLAIPKLKLRVKPGAILEVPREDGEGNDYIRPRLAKFTLYQGTTELPVTLKNSFAGDEISLVPTDILRSNTAYRLAVLIDYEQNINGSWVTLTENGIKAEEPREITFTTGSAPDTLDYNELQRMYPFFDQRNFYKDETNKGVIKLGRRYHDFWTPFAKWKVKIENLAGTSMGISDVTIVDDSLLKFTLPPSLTNSTTYRLLLLGEGPTVEDKDANKPALKFTFTTSKFGTLLAKLQTLKVTQAVVNRISSDVIDLQAVVQPYEGFELYEIAGDKYTEYKPTIQGFINVDGEEFYNTLMKPLIYPNYPGPIVASGVPVKIESAAGLTYGAPPFKAVTPSWYYINSLESGTYNDLLRTRLPFVYNPHKYYSLHYLELRAKIINMYANRGLTIPTEFKALVQDAFPFLLKGQYKAKLTFVALDGTLGTTGEFIYENPIE